MMMQPIQSSLSSLISNAFMLVGGLVFCYVKSYRLSMLAFVTVGPIMYLWDLYAAWSKRLNRQMLASWAEGNSIASQALSHIRTLKAFGTENSEINAYNDANRDALKAGVKDAWGNGLTTALTSYLDLGTGVLILYYGGTLVMDEEMSVGEVRSMTCHLCNHGNRPCPSP
jgi:ATP-binding cassette subfamily B protein